MLKNRFSAVVTVKNDIVVQSFKFNEYLPIGKPKIILNNLCEWKADEIILLSLDNTFKKHPNFNLVQSVSDKNLNIPLIYGGGIKNAEDAKKIINLGADKIIISSLFFENPKEVIKISELIGKESLILNLIFKKKENNYIYYNCLKKKFENKEISNSLDYFSDYFSEIMLSDFLHDGVANSFDANILKQKDFTDKEIIVFGGISETKQIKNLINKKNIRSIAIGNFLNYQESSILNIKQKFKNEFRD